MTGYSDFPFRSSSSNVDRRPSDPHVKDSGSLRYRTRTKERVREYPHCSFPLSCLHWCLNHSRLQPSSPDLSTTRKGKPVHLYPHSDPLHPNDHPSSPPLKSNTHNSHFTGSYNFTQNQTSATILFHGVCLPEFTVFTHLAKTSDLQTRVTRSYQYKNHSLEVRTFLGGR